MMNLMLIIGLCLMALFTLVSMNRLAGLVAIIPTRRIGNGLFRGRALSLDSAMKMLCNTSSSTPKDTTSSNDDGNVEMGAGQFRFKGKWYWGLIGAVLAIGGTYGYQWLKGNRKKDADNNKHNNNLNEIKEKGEEDRKTAKREHEYAVELEKEKAEQKIRIMQMEYDLKNRGTQESTSPQSDTTPEPWTCHTLDELISKGDDSNVWIVPEYVRTGQISVLLGGAGVGKTTLMVQTAFCAATGTAHFILAPDVSCSVQTDVLYYRLEPFAGEFEERYTEEGLKTLNSAGIMWKTLAQLDTPSQQKLLDDIKAFVTQMRKNTLICVDPLSKLSDWNAEKFISGFEEIQRSAALKGLELSCLVCAHTDEIPDYNILTTREIKGGDGLIQKAGSVFALRRARGKDSARFIQTLKAPKGCADPGKVLVGEIVDEKPFLHMRYLEHKRMEEALPLKPKACVDDEPEVKAQSGRADNLEWTNEMVDLLKKMSEQKVSQNDIAKALSDHLDGRKVFPMQVSRKMDELGLK